MGDKIVELVDVLKERFQTIAIDGEDESWTIYVDPLENGQFLVTYLDREDMREHFALADDLADLKEVLDELTHQNELV